MSRPLLMDGITDVFRRVLDAPDLVLTEEATPATVEGWDSLSHVQIVADLESRFAVRFTMAEIQSFATVARILEALGSRVR